MFRISNRRSLAPGLCALLLLLGLPRGGLGQSVAEDIPLSAYATPARQVAVDGERRLNLFCLGEGAPLVLLEAGAISDASTWRRVQGRIAAFTRVCSYDRAGYGFSDPGSSSSTPQQAVDDLERLLDQIPASHPIVLVGHSAGGLYATLFAEQHRARVGGLVLVDPAIRSQLKLRYGLETPAERSLDQMADAAVLTRWSDCIMSADLGADLQTVPACDGRVSDDAPAAARAGLIERFNSPKIYAQRIAELTALNAFMLEDPPSSASTSFGALPLIVLTAGANTIGFFSPETNAKHQAMLRRGHEQVAARSTLGRDVVVPDSGHGIQFAQPQAVVDAVREVVETVRERSAPGAAQRQK